MLNKIKYDEKLIRQTVKMFPEWTELHENMRLGKTQPVLEFLYSRVGFSVNEDDVIRAFRNKKENKILQLAERAKNVRELYQKVYLFLDKHETRFVEKHGFEDCV